MSSASPEIGGRSHERCCNHLRLRCSLQLHLRMSHLERMLTQTSWPCCEPGKLLSCSACFGLVGSQSQSAPAVKPSNLRAEYPKAATKELCQQSYQTYKAYDCQPVDKREKTSKSKFEQRNSWSHQYKATLKETRALSHLSRAWCWLSKGSKLCLSLEQSYSSLQQQACGQRHLVWAWSHTKSRACNSRKGYKAVSL